MSVSVVILSTIIIIIISTLKANIGEEERLGFEKCLTQNYLIKHGQDYFGTRDLIYIDLYGRDDLRALMSYI